VISAKRHVAIARDPNTRNPVQKHAVAHCQFEYGSTVTHNRCKNTWPARVTPSSAVEVKSVCAASPGPPLLRPAMALGKQGAALVQQLDVHAFFAGG